MSGGFGLSFSVLSLVLLTFSCTTVEPEPGLEYHLALRRTPIPEVSTRVEVEPGWVNDVYRAPTGAEVLVTRRKEPELVVTIDVIRGVDLYRSSWSAALVPSSRTVQTRIELPPEVKARLDAIASDYSGYWLLVTHRGAAIDLIPIGVNLSDAISGGLFSSEEQARSFYRPISDRVHLAMPAPPEVQERRDAVDQSAGAVLWHIRCDERFRSELEAEGFDTEGFLSDNASLAADVDCSVPPVELPGARGLRE